MTSTTHGPRIADLRLPPPRPAFQGAALRSMRRSASLYAALWAAGLALTLLGGERGQAFGAGLALPGGGQLAVGAPWWALAAVGGFVLALTTWWSMGPTVLPPLVWLGLAGAGAAAADGPGSIDDTGTVLAFATGPALLTLGALTHLARHRQQTRRAVAVDARLREVRLEVRGAPDLALPMPVTESSADDLAHLRYGLDLALQPMDSFDGFTHLDQFREAALRYQLNALSYGLSMAQFTRTPAFSGYLAEGQRNAIEKMLLRKSWGYWAIENAWGNGSLDKDPVDNRDNVMLTGFYGVMIGMYATLNDDRYSRPGALTFVWNDEQRYAYDFASMTASIRRNIERSDYSLFACEPNWIYTICNTFGLNTMLSHDRLYGTDHAAAVLPHLEKAYETDFLRPDGRIIGVRSKHLGLSWNFWASPSVQMATTFWLHPGLPDVSLRTWALLREGSLRIRDGRLSMPLTITGRLDPGNYKLGRDTFSQAVTILAAQEIGDDEYADAARATIAEREPISEQDGARRYADASGLVNHYLALGRFGRRDGLRDLVVHGTPHAWRSGPVLAEAAYPDVLVAKAVTDGDALDLVLLPGAGPVRTTLAVERLVPRRTYAVLGAVTAQVVADDDGRALLEVDLGGRTEVRLY